jgi:hypothetical protein
MSGPPVIGLSISESPDLAWLGFGPPHLGEAMVEIARYLLIAGASLAYGGDLRPGGFTRQLFEMVRSYRRDSPVSLPIANYLAWSVHSEFTDQQVEALEREFDGVGRLVFLDPDGFAVSNEERRREIKVRRSKAMTLEERAETLTAMRRRMTEECAARVIIGGKVKNYSGTMPGVAEEALQTLASRKALYAVGGFGGCTRDLIHALEEHEDQDIWPERKQDEIGRGYNEAIRAFGEHTWEGLYNGLSREDNRALAASSNSAVILRYLLRGLYSIGLLHQDGVPESRETCG